MVPFSRWGKSRTFIRNLELGQHLKNCEKSWFWTGLLSNLSKFRDSPMILLTNLGRIVTILVDKSLTCETKNSSDIPLKSAGYIWQNCWCLSLKNAHPDCGALVSLNSLKIIQNRLTLLHKALVKFQTPSLCRFWEKDRQRFEVKALDKFEQEPDCLLHRGTAAVPWLCETCPPLFCSQIKLADTFSPRLQVIKGKVCCSYHWLFPTWP